MISSETKNVSESVWHDLQKKVQQKKIAEAFRLLRNETVEPILIKGWAIARLYPAHRKRPFADIDLCVAPEDFKKGQKILETEKAKGLNIDLHCGLRHLDTVVWEDLFENSRLFEIEDEQIRVLRVEDHLRVLAVHWLTDGGAHKEKLRDIFYSFAAEPEKFDWERCLNTVGENRRRWIVCTIGLAEKHLAISLAGTPFETEKIEIPGWVSAALEKEWHSGFRLKPLQTCLGDRKELFRQIKKRFPPNPIQATVELEGSFDRKSPFLYQFASVFKRALPSFRRIGEVILRNKAE